MTKENQVEEDDKLDDAGEYEVIVEDDDAESSEDEYLVS